MARDLHQSRGPGDIEEDLPEPPQIRRLRRLVSALMVVLMVGILFIAAALVWKLTQSEAAPPIAAEIKVPQGFEVLSVSRTGSRLYLVIENSQTGVRQIEERDASDQRVIGTYRLVPES